MLVVFETQHGVLIVVRMGGGDVDDVDVGVLDEFRVGAVGFGVGGGGDVAFFEEVAGAGGGTAGGGGGDGVLDVVNVAGGWGDEEVEGEGFGYAAGGWRGEGWLVGEVRREGGMWGRGRRSGGVMYIPRMPHRMSLAIFLILKRVECLSVSSRTDL